MKKYFENLAKALLGQSYGELSDNEKEVIKSIADGEPLAENINLSFHEQMTFGQRLADQISKFGGSWTFILIFLAILVSWMFLNSYILVANYTAFDPYPYILLNLVLSSLAALQAPVIMMSQNRQAAKDRLEISANYKVSLKTDLEITRLHEKIDSLTKEVLRLSK